MNTILVSPKDDLEFQLITDLFSKMKVKTKVLSLEEDNCSYLKLR